MNQQTKTHKPAMENFQEVPYVIWRESTKVLSRFVKTRIVVFFLEKDNA